RCWLGASMRWKPVKAGRDMAAFTAAELDNAPPPAQSRPQRIIVVHVISQAEHDCVIREAPGQAHEMLKGACRHDRINGRDERRSAGQPGGDNLKARVG